MYCYTYVNDFNCVANELILWSDISSEHPIFVRTVADLSNKSLEGLVTQLMTVSTVFEGIKKKGDELRKQLYYNYQNPYLYLNRIKGIVREFLEADKLAIEIYDRVKQIGREDKVWQTLLEHIMEEQEFMYKLFTDINNQLNLYANV